MSHPPAAVRAATLAAITGTSVMLAAMLALAAPAAAHELRPLYLNLREQGAGVFAVLWKVPRAGDATLSVRPVLPGPAPMPQSIAKRDVEGAAVVTWTAETGELRGRKIGLRGLDATLTDALVRVEFADGTAVTRRLTPRAPDFVVPARESAIAIAGTYLVLGVEHILSGIDHLMFVLALLLLTGWRWSLVRTVTAFTAAHSLTLALAALGFVHVPQSPVEAMIALSIVFVAAQVARGRGRSETAPVSPPWTMAFGFGLLHGLGFAGALAGIGLPESHVPLALLLFNCGVEAGQLLFLGALFGASFLVRRLVPHASWRLPAAAYGLGIVATYWTIERVASF